MLKTKRQFIMYYILLLLVFQSFCSTQILGSEQCNYKGRFESYLDAAVDLINKAKTYVPENPNVAEEISSSIDCEKVLQICQSPNTVLPTSHSTIIPTVSQEEINHPVDCEEVLSRGYNSSGVYTIWPRNKLTDRKPLDVYCDMDTDGGGWTVIQRRGKFNRPRTFFWQDWESYKNGFGNITEDFWLGNDNIFTLTNQREYSIRFDLKSTKGEKRYAVYDVFWIEDEDHKYKLHIQNYSGDAGNSMIRAHANQKFTTKDQDNDGSEDNCSRLFRGGWWYSNCGHVNLNGVYRHEQLSVDGIFWLSFTGPSESLETTEMKIRPMNFTKI